MRTLLVTSANEAYASFLRELTGSLQQCGLFPSTHLACFDLGLGEKSRAWAEQQEIHLALPEWDLPVDAQLRADEPWLRAITARPFLPRYFPGYDIYLWIDSDTWVQERFAVDWYVNAAATGALAMTPQVHHAYRHGAGDLSWRMRRMEACFGHDFAQRLLWKTYFNAGVFALRADAPHWNIWAASFREGLMATQGKVCCDQTAINHAIWTHGLHVNALPALCNWLCHLALPHFDNARQRFCEPAIPGQPIGIVHLSAATKDATVKIIRDGVPARMSLRFSARTPNC